MWLIVIIVVKPPAKLPEHGAGVGQGIEARIVALEGSYEGLSQAVGFGTRDWREARNQVELGGESARLLRRIGPSRRERPPAWQLHVHVGAAGRLPAPIRAPRL